MMHNLVFTLSYLLVAVSVAPPAYPWLAAAPTASQAVAARFAPPPGCRREFAAAGTWGEWLRGLPLRPAGTPARLYTGQLKDRQDVVAAVVAIDVGPKDLHELGRFN